MLITPAFAADAAATTTAAATTGAPADPTTLIFNIGFVVILFVLFYVMMIRPQQKRMKEQQDMITALGVGDKVITNGGIIGVITKQASEDSAEVEMEIAPGTKVTILRYSIYKKYDPEEYAPKNINKKKAA